METKLHITEYKGDFVTFKLKSGSHLADKIVLFALIKPP